MKKPLLMISAAAAAAAGAYLYAICPNIREKRLIPDNRFAHRGLYDNIGIPENSLAAFRRASENGYGTELDIQYTKDRRIVVFHDDTLERMCGRPGRIDDYTYEELKAFRLLDTDERIPLFSEVLEAMNGAPVICELKSQKEFRSTEICGLAVGMIKDYRGFICVESFDPFIVKWFRLNHPEIIRGQLACHANRTYTGFKRIGAELLGRYMYNFLSRPDFLAYDYRQDCLGLELGSRLFGAQTVTYSPRGDEAVEMAQARFDRVIFEIDR
ncbi:MAG: glycerophosphodiester phosphodiesterase [Eubacteriales bacterium]|nr:glycerophosphodiester phosphodiesterase [Eubacteriales bacterium]